MPHVIEGHGDTARFRDFRALRPRPGENPYRTYRRSVQHAFREGWTRFKHDMDTCHPGMLAAWRYRNHSLWKSDPTGRHTGVRIGPKHYQTGGMLGTEMAYAALGLGLAIESSSYTAPLLRENAATRSQRLELAGTLIPRMIHARAIANLRRAFWTKSTERIFAPFDSLRIHERPNGSHVFNQRGGQFRAYDPACDPKLSVPTIGCMALLFRLPGAEQTWALDDAVTASLHAADEMDLFRPGIALEAWEQRRRLLERPRIAQFVAGLAEDLTLHREDPRLKDLYRIFDREFI
jgi:hypothetical protein